MTPDGKLGVGIVGIGWVAGEHIKAFEANPHANVIALCSSSRENAENVRQTHGLGPARVYTDYEQFLQDPEIDIVAVCSVNNLHVEQGVAAAQAGKHLLLEKPVAIDLPGLRQLNAAIETAGVKTQVGFVLHWNPYFESVKAMVAGDFFGSIYYGECDYFSGNWEKWYPGYHWARQRAKAGGALICAGCHAVDALRWFMPGEVVEVFGYEGRFTDVMEWEPTTLTVVKFDSGAIGKIGCILEGNLKYQFNLRLHGAKGTLDNEYFLSDHLPGQTGWASFPTIMPDTPEVTHHPFPGEVNDFIDAIREDREAQIPMSDAVKTHELIFAAEISAREGRPVSLPLPA